jgi:chromosome segregation ATPase
MRAVISYENVAAAAEAIELQGVKPTIERIRDRLRDQGFGRGGSATTVSMHFNRWKEGRPDSGARSVHSITDPLWIAAQSVRDQVRQELQKAFDAMELKVREDAQQQVNSAFAEARRASEELVLAEQRARDKHEEATAQSDRADAAARQAATAQALLDKAEADLNEQHQQLATTLTRADAAVAAAQAAQTQIAAELDRARTETARRQTELTQANTQLDVLQRAILESEARNAEERQLLTRRIDTLVDSLNAAMSREADATRDASVQAERARALDRKVAQLEDALADARKAESRWQDEALKQSRHFEQLQQEIQTFRASQGTQEGSVERLAEQIRHIEQLILRKQGGKEQKK